MADSKDFPRDSDALALAIEQLIPDPRRRALAEKADRVGAHDHIRHRANPQAGVRGKPATNES